ncbi:MAG: Lrp/AsnC family transcriptional regulator [Candidatus Woesearchaeota archaeon]
MNKINKKILYLLSNNARENTSTIAKHINRTPATTQKRIEKLQEKNILQNTHPIIDNSTLGYIGQRAYIKLNKTTPKQEQELFNWLVQHKKTSVIGKTRGSYDVLIMSWVQQTQDFHTLIQELKENYRQHIQELKIHTYLRTHHYQRAYLQEKTTNQLQTTTGDKQQQAYDTTDIQLIQAILTNARKPIVEIAQEINQTARTTLNRLRALEKKNIIVGYSANISLNKIGKHYYKAGITLETNTSKKTLMQFAEKNPNTIYVDETLGEYDFEINVEVDSNQAFEDILNELKQLTNGFKRIEYFEVVDFKKLTYLATNT